MKILVSTDTSCVINYEILEKNNISVFPLNVIIDGKEYLDGVTIDQDSLLQAMNENKEIKTSTPPLGMIIEYFEKLFEQGYDKIIHFTISSKLSSMNDLFKNVSKNYFEDNIIVVDSQSLSSLMLSHILYAVDEVNKGSDLEEIILNLEKRKEKNYVSFIPRDLTTLKKGGRISPVIAAIGNTLGLKPVISLIKGELVKENMTTNLKKKLKDTFNSRIEKYPIKDFDYTVVSFGEDPKIMEALCQYIEETQGIKPIKGIVPINVCAHSGPGTVGILATPKINGKSIKDFE